MISRIIFAASGVAAGLFWASEQGYLSAECSTCAGAASSGVVAALGAGVYLLAAGLTPKRFLTKASVAFAGVHGLLVFSQFLGGVFCWFCASMLVVALGHAFLRIWKAQDARRGLPFAFAGGVIASTGLLAMLGAFAEPAPPEIIETQTYAATAKTETPREASPDAESVSATAAASEVPVFEGPVVVKAYVRSTCGFCQEFKNIMLPALLARDDMPAFTIQYIAAPPERSVPYFVLDGASHHEIKGLPQTKRFAETLKRAMLAN